MMRKLIILSTILCLYATSTLAAGRIHSVKYSELMVSATISIDLSLPTDYAISQSGQRIDILLPRIVDDGLVELPNPANLLVKALLGNERKGTVASFMFRSPPTRFQITSPNPSSQVLINVFWEKETVSRRLAIAVKKHHKEKAKFAGRWKDFFKEFNPPMSTSLKRVYQTPPMDMFFPGIYESGNNEGLKRAINKIKERDYSLASSYLRSIREVNLEGSDLKPFYVSQIEAFCRTGFLDLAKRATEKLSALENTEETEKLAAWFQIFRFAANGEQHRAYITYREKAGSNPEQIDNVATSLLVAEIEMETGRKDIGVSALQDIAKEFPSPIGIMATMSLANHYTDEGLFDDAMALFDQLRDIGISIGNDLSMGLRYGEALFQTHKYSEAAETFDTMSWRHLEDEKISLVFFGAGRAHLMAGHDQIAAARFGAAINSFPTSEGAVRSIMEMADSNALAGDDEHAIEASKGYRGIMEKSGNRALREEAAFKNILLMYITNRIDSVVDEADVFMRDYFGSELKHETEALLAEVLPQHIIDLTKNKNYLRALTILEKHKHLLIGETLDKKFLEAAGEAFSALGLTTKAVKLYSFMIERTSDAKRDHDLYIPLAKVLRNGQRIDEARRTISEFKKRFPQSKSMPEANEIELELLYLEDNFEGVAAKYKTFNNVAPRESHIIAGRAFWKLERYKEAARAFTEGQVSHNSAADSPHNTFMLAESLFQSKQKKRAKQVFQSLAEVKTYRDIALYRSAQLAEENKDHSALNNYKEVAEGSSDSAWRSLGRLKLSPYDSSDK